MIPFGPASLPAVCGGGVLIFGAVEVLVWTGVDFFSVACDASSGEGYVRNTKIWPDTASPKFFFFFFLLFGLHHSLFSWRKELGRDE